MICTYWWRFSEAGEREVEQDKRSELVRSVLWAVRRKTLEYSNHVTA